MKCIMNLKQKEIMLRMFILLIMQELASYAQTYTYSDLLIVQQQEVANYQSSVLNPSSPQNTFTLPLPSQFKSPSILLAINQLDIDTRTSSIAYGVEAKIVGSNIIITATQYYDSIITNLRVMYMLIEHPSVFVTSETFIIPPSNQNLLIYNSKFYKKSSPPKAPAVYAYITGYKSTIQGNVHKVSISVVQTDLDFVIQIQRSDNGITQVSYNYIEVYDENSIGIPPLITSSSAYYSLQQGSEQTYIDSTSTHLYDDVSNLTNGLERFAPVITLPIDITIPSSLVLSHSQVGVQFGFSGFEFDISNRSQGLRLQIDKTSFSNKQFFFQYRTWNTCRVRGAVGQYIYIKMLVCSLNSSTNTINYSSLSQCVNQCPVVGYYQATDNSRNISICQPCHQSCLSCSGSLSNQCLSCTATQGLFLNQTSNTCDSCSLQCAQCTDLNTCTQCSSNFPYFFNSTCFAQQPPNTFCDASTKVCTSCPPTCNTCTSNLKCIDCKNSTDYFMNGNCSSTPPPNSYCNQIRMCYSCPSNCQGCDATLKCTQCISSAYYWYFGICYESQPPSTYCNVNTLVGIQNYCKQCHNACTSCTGPTFNECSLCQDGYTFDNGSCFCSKQGYSYNNKSQECDQCIVLGCIDCKNDISICELCDDKLSLQLDTSANECYCQDITKYYSNQQSICIANSIPHCKVSTRFQNNCEKCQDGYLNVEQKICSFCGKYKYTDSNNQCVNNCNQHCFICIDNNSCILQDDQINDNSKSPSLIDYSNYKCHYSCSICNGNTSNQCLKCSSDTRQYSIADSSCNCKANAYDIAQPDCILFKDLSQSFLDIETIIFILFFLIQIPFLFFEKYTFLNYNFSAVQLLSILTNDANLYQNLNYVKILNLFQKLSIVNFMQFSFISDDNAQIELEVNSLIIQTIVLFIICLLNLLLMLLKKYKIKVFCNQFLLSCNRLISTPSICLIANLYCNFDLLSQSEIILLVISTSIQSLTTLLTLNSLLSNQLQTNNNKQDLEEGSSQNNLTNSLNNFTAAESAQTLSNDNSNTSTDSNNHLKRILISFEMRRILLGIMLAVMNRSKISIFIACVIGLFQIGLFIVYKPFNSLQKNSITTIIELFLLTCFLMHSMVKNDLSIHNDQKSNDITGMLIQLILISIIIIQIIVIISTFITAFNIICSKFQLKQQSSNSLSLIDKKIPSSINKSTIFITNLSLLISNIISLFTDQIDQILNSSANWSYNPFSSKYSKQNIFSMKRKTIV